MTIRMEPDSRPAGIAEIPDEEVWLLGYGPGDEADGPYQFTSPGVDPILRAQRHMRGLSLDAAAMRALDAQYTWLAKGFGPDVWAHIVARLDDEGDQLGESHLTWLYQQLTNANTGRPTTSSNGAARPQWKRPSPAAPSAPASVSVP